MKKEFDLIGKLDKIAKEFDIKENIDNYHPRDYIKARQRYTLYRLNGKLNGKLKEKNK